MSEGNQPLTREERLAAKLRENLRRRKEQAREMLRTPSEPLSESERGLSKDESPR